jgi:hypothetical protein
MGKENPVELNARTGLDSQWGTVHCALCCGYTMNECAGGIKMKMCAPHCCEEGDWSASSPKVLYSEGGRYLKLSFARSPAMEWNQEHFYKWGDSARRGVCKGFSFGSRRRMLDRLNQVSVGAEHPDFVTLTLPDDSFQDSVADFAKTAKLHLDVLLKRLHRACPSACGFWRIEWKARKSGSYEGKLFPHFHLLIWGLPSRDVGVEKFNESFVPVRDCQLSFAGLCGELIRDHLFKSLRSAEDFLTRRDFHQARVDDHAHIAQRLGVEYTFMSFFDWVSLAWYHVVGTGNVDHFLAGCRVEKIRTWGGVLSYCAKYMSKADSESFMVDIAAGRSWGIFNRALMPWAKLVEIDLSDDVGNRVRRIARRYLEHRLGKRVQRHYGLTLYCDTAKFAPLFARPPDTPF